MFSNSRYLEHSFLIYWLQDTHVDQCLVLKYHIRRDLLPAGDLGAEFTEFLEKRLVFFGESADRCFAFPR